MDLDKLRRVDDLKSIKGIAYPADVGFRKLIVTGPPGSGKTSRIEALGGWPGEVLLDLTRGNWWRDRTLTVRPREVHLGLPFVGSKEATTAFEEVQQEAVLPELEPERLRLPPRPRRFTLVDWRRRFVFEFLLPPAEKVLAVRQQRAVAQTHAVDSSLYLEQIRYQLETHFQVAEFLHHGGLRVLLRVDFDGGPRVFRATPDVGPAAPREASVSGRRLFDRVVGRLMGSRPERAIQSLERLRLIGEGATLSPELLPVELRQGGVQLRLHRDRLVLPSGPELDALILVDRGDCAGGIHGFARFGRGQRVRMTRGSNSQATSLPLPPDTDLRLEIANRDMGVVVTDLHSNRGTEIVALQGQAGSDLLGDEHDRNMRLLEGVFGSPIVRRPTEEILRSLGAVNERLTEGVWRRPDRDGGPGGLVELPPEIHPVLVGDLHANVDNLLKILCVNGFLAEVAAGRAALIFLGDAVHGEEESQLAEMDSSLLMMELILRLMEAFPDHVIYLRGNHDSFSSDLTKEGVPQGRLWRKRMDEVWGKGLRKEFERFYSLCPLVASSHDFVACHAGPPRGQVSLKKLVNVSKHPSLEHQLMWARVKGPGRPAGYVKQDVKALKSALGLSSKAAMVVSHNPSRDGSSVWLDAGGIKRHHVVYSAGLEELAVFTRLGDRLRPLVYRAEPMLAELGGRPTPTGEA